MITRSASKCSQKATTDDKNLYTPRSQRTLRSSVSEKKQRSVVKETNEILINNTKNANLKRSRTPLSTPRKKIRNKSPETSKEEHVETQKTYPELPQTPIFNINIHVPPITMNSPLPGLPPIQPIICLNFDDLSKTITGKETFTSSSENIEKNVEKLKDLFTKVTPKCNIIYKNGENSFTPDHNTNVFQCSTKNNNLNSDVKSNVNLNFNSNFNNSMKKTMKDSITSSKQVNTLRSSKSSKKEKLNLLENDKDFMSIAPEINGKLNSLIRKELRRNLSASDLDDLKIVTKKKLKSSGVDKKISNSNSNSFEKFNLKEAVVVLENIDCKIHKNVNQELSFESFSERVSKTSSLNNSKNSVEGDFEEDSSKSCNLKLKKDVSKKSKKPENNYSKSSTGITSSEYLKNDLNFNTDQNCIGSERISKDEILRNIKTVVGNYKSGCESDSSDTEIVEGTTECLNNSFKQTKVNCNSGENENIVDNRNKTDFSSTKKSFKSSEKNKINCKKSLQFDNSDLQTTKKERGKVYSLVYDSDTNDSHQKEKISSIIEGCNFSELIKKIQNSEIRKEILSLMKKSDNLNSKNPEVCNSGKNCGVSETEKTLGGSKNVDTDNQLEKCQESNKNTGAGSEMSQSNVEKNTSFCDSDETYFSDDFTPNKRVCNFDDLSEWKEKSEKNKTNNTGDFNNIDSATNSVIFDDGTESMSSASTVLFDDGLKSCTRSKENESDEEALNESNDDCSDYEKNVINVGSSRKKKKKNESKYDGKNSESSEDGDSDSSEDEIEKNEKDFSSVRSSTCGSKETNSNEFANKRKKSEISKKPENNKKCDEPTEKVRKNISSDRDSSDTSEDETEGQNSKIVQSKCNKSTENIGKNISSDSDSSEDENKEERNGNINITGKKYKKIEEERGSKTKERLSSDDEDAKKKSMVSKKVNDSKFSEQIEKVSETESMRTNTSSDSDGSEEDDEKIISNILKQLNKDINKITELFGENTEKEIENTKKNNSSSSSDSSDDEVEEKISKDVKKVNNDCSESVQEKIEAENTRKSISSDSDSSDCSEDEKKENSKVLKNENNKCNNSIEGKEKRETENVRKSVSSDSDSNEEEEDKKIVRKILKQVNKGSKYKKVIEENREKETKNTRKNNSSSSSDSSEDEDEEEISKDVKKVNNNCSKSVKEKIESKNIRKSISSDSGSSDGSEDEENSKILKKENNKCSNSIEGKEKRETENVRKSVSSDSDSSENENEEKSNKVTINSNGDKGFNGKTKEQKKIDENVCEKSDSSEDDDEEEHNLILKKANCNKKCGEKVIEEESETENVRKNVSSDESEGENKKKTNYDNSLNGKFEEQKRKRFKNISESSDDRDSEGENQKERCSGNLIKKVTGGSFSREERNGLKQTKENDESKNTSVSCSESSESEDEGDEKTVESFEKLNRKERKLENVKRNIFKDDFRSENEEKNNKSPKKIIKSNGCGENPEEEIECAVSGKYNSESRESRNHKRGNISGETEEGGKKKVNGKKRKKMETEEEEESDNDDCESENGFSGGCGGDESKKNGGGHPDGDKPREKGKEMMEIQRSEVQTLETEIKDLPNDNNSELEEEQNLNLSEEGKVKRHAKSPKKGKKNLGKSPGKRKVQVIEKGPNHQESSPRKKKMGKLKSKAEIKSKKKMYKEDYIPLRAMGSTRFAVSNLNKIQPYQKHSALNFKNEMFFGDSVKRFKSNAEYAAYKHKQNVRNFKE